MTARIMYVNAALVGLFAISVNSLAADNATTGTKVAYQQALDVFNGAQTPMEKNTLVFSAAPRGTLEASVKKYGPLTEYLSKAIGKKIVYQYPGTWGVYQGKMQKGVYDLVYDGPHLNGWRVAKLQHNIVARIPNDLVFVIVVKKGNTRITSVEQLAGRTVCAHAPPNLGTLMLLAKFENPARQPAIVAVDGWDNIFKGMMADQCVAALVPKNAWEKNDKGGVASKLIYKSNPLPNQAFSAGPRISKEDQAKISQALLSPAAAPYIESVVSEYNATSLVAANRDEYVVLGDLLKNEWGYN